MYKEIHRGTKNDMVYFSRDLPVFKKQWRDESIVGRVWHLYRRFRRIYKKG